VEALAADGHPDPLRYTPRQALALVELAGRRRAREMATQLGLMRLAHQGSVKDVKKALRELDSWT
jgi:late competence protein required for DNA uptake (superfamily II DNA/RNA helicase)